jgi:hypothetical protein
MKYDGIGVYSIQFHHHLLFFLPSNSSIRLLYFICSHVFFYSASMFHHLLPCVLVYIVDSLLQCYKNRTEPVGRTGQTANRRGDRSGSNVGSAMQLDRWESLKTGEPAVFSNCRFDCTRFFFFSAKSLKTTSFFIFFF